VVLPLLLLMLLRWVMRAAGLDLDARVLLLPLPTTGLTETTRWWARTPLILQVSCKRRSSFGEGLQVSQERKNSLANKLGGWGGKSGRKPSV
jgi:hypothetical protein